MVQRMVRSGRQAGSVTGRWLRRRPIRVGVGLLAVLVVVALGATGCAPANASATPTTLPITVESPSGHRPVLIVPGFAVSCFNGPVTEWQAWADAFAADGWAAGEVSVLVANRCETTQQVADVIGGAVNQLLAATGADQVDVIAHSMGAVPARWCVKFGSCSGKVANFVSLAGANHGSGWAGLCPLQYWSAGCADLVPGSAVLTALNTGDETPDGTAWQTWVSWCELQVVPNVSALLVGADNHLLNDRCVDHDGWKRDAVTIATVVPQLAGDGVPKSAA